MNWPKTLAYAVFGVLVANLGILILLVFGANNLSNAADDLTALGEGQAAARDRSECLTGYYKDFFAATAAALSELDQQGDLTADTSDSLARSARDLPRVDELCS